MIAAPVVPDPRKSSWAPQLDTTPISVDSGPDAREI
jgi:hypothetical protein